MPIGRDAFQQLYKVFSSMNFNRKPLPAANFLSTIFGLLFVTTLIACGSSEKKQSDTQPPPDPGDKTVDVPPVDKDLPVVDETPTPVLVFLGGYTSCPSGGTTTGPMKMDLADMFYDAKEALKEGGYKGDPAFLVSCYSFDPAVVTYVTSSDPEQIKNRAVDAMLRDFSTLLGKISNPQIFIVGHSYGAYTALEMLKNPEHLFSLQGLTTLDAISKVGCTPEGALPAILGTGPAAKGCLESPSDITPAEYLGIAKRTVSWQNFYQVDSTILHSSEIALASNVKLTYSSSGVNPHNDLLFDQKVKDAVVSQIVSAFFPEEVPDLSD